MGDDLADKMEGVELSNGEPQPPPLLMEDERRMLELYDRLEELQLEIALLKAQGVLSKNVPKGEVTDEDLAKAQQDLLNAKARYTVRNRVVESVLIANPILKAVHAGGNASVTERDLLPLLQQRDILSLTLTSLSASLLSSRTELRQVETTHMTRAQENANLAAEMLVLAEEANTQRKEDINDPKARELLDELEQETKMSRQRWRIMKETAGASIVGSGVDWTRDERLLGIVMDREE